MNLRCALLCILGLRLLPGADPGITRIHNIYVLPMAGGLDQYIANKITEGGRYQIVTDPKQAHALFTDHIGEAFEDKFAELYPPPAPPKPVESEKDKKAAAASGDQRSIGSMLGEAAPVKRNSSFNRGKGNVFLIDVPGKRVLWSTYLRPESTRTDDMNKLADRIVDRLESDYKGALKRQATATAVGAPIAAPAPVAAPAAAPLATPAAAPAPAKPAPAK